MCTAVDIKVKNMSHAPYQWKEELVVVAVAEELVCLTQISVLLCFSGEEVGVSDRALHFFR